ncbi:MAG TPA: pitrilysin family protein [Pyrinomonadaceae bacterium]|nr:pitrilysin family protein [Pyrinomonadaceae bacterium]
MRTHLFSKGLPTQSPKNERKDLRFSFVSSSASLRLCASTVLLFVVAVAGVVNAQTPQATPPPPAPSRSGAFPKPVEQTLPNGLRVIVIERRESPLIAAQLLIKNGSEVDPPELPGLADLTADLLTKGTQTRDATKIAQEIESLGGTLDSGARWDSSFATVGVMSSKIPQAMEILADVVRRPTFKSEEVERLRQQYLDNFTLALGDPGTIARFVAARVVFGDSPYGHPVAGTTDSLTRITAADITKLHSRYYRPDNAILVIGGDINAKDGFDLGTKYFGDWQKPTTPLPTSDATMESAATAKSGRVVVIDKPDAGQAAVYLARTGITRKDPDYFRGIVTNSVLSGYSGRLNQEIRIKRGLSYGAGSSLDARRGVGPFVASAQTKNESGAQVADLLLGEITRLSASPPADVELTPRKAVLVGSFSRNLETATGLVGQVASLALYGMGLDEINRYINNVQAIGTADIQKFAGTRLDAKTSNIIIVGNAKAFLPELQKKYPNVEVIPVTELDLNTALLRKKKP